MSFFQNLSIIAVITASLFSQFSFAKEITITGDRCIEADTQKTWNSLNDFGEWSKLRGAVYTDTFLKVYEITLLTLAHSTVTQSFKGGGKVVKLIFQPLNFSEESLYPRFSMACKANEDSPGIFHQKCLMNPESEHFVISNFVSNIHLQPSDICGAKHRMTYAITVTTNPDELNQIKNKAAGRVPGGASLLDLVFNEDKFFSGFYDNLYTTWMDDLK